MHQNVDVLIFFIIILKKTLGFFSCLIFYPFFLLTIRTFWPKIKGELTKIELAFLCHDPLTFAMK